MDAEREVLDVLARNAREDIDDIAAQTGLDAAAVEDAIAALEADHVVHGYQAVIDWDHVDVERHDVRLDEGNAGAVRSPTTTFGTSLPLNPSTIA